MTSRLITRKNYNEINRAMQVGDVIAFGGDSLFSKWTKLTTNSSVTHTAVIVDPDFGESTDDGCTNCVAESTVFNGKSGVMFNSLSERVKTYQGDIWWLPLAEGARETLEHNKINFNDFLQEQQGKKYDIWQLFGSTVDATDSVPLLHHLSRNTEDFSSWFCSELVAAAFNIAGVTNRVNASEVTPIDLCQFNIYAENYIQFKGEEKDITGINSLVPDGWGHHFDKIKLNDDPVI
jgi:hypothetical protein